MVPVGLTRRLHQHSRRGGVAVGLSMLVAALVLLGGFVLIYGALDPYTRDFVAADLPEDPTPTAAAVTAEPATTGEEPTAAPVDEPPAEGDDQESAPTPTATTGPAPTVADQAFTPDYQVDPGADTSINFRTEPSIAGGQSTVIIALPPGTQLESQGDEREDADNPAENGTWLLFETEDGQQGWVREIDVVQS
ncbi:MAG: hypothetical protein H0U40_01655 [Chloroflexia bacterium]|nr:hypothetical protein [Chloroflexia bacterium]MDQ3513831.1 hypothetical protein [Chloroflexota bacterium]